MMIAWMIYGLVVGALIAGSAWVLERGFRGAGRSVRWIWVGALALTVLLIGTAPFRTALLAPGDRPGDSAAVMASAPVLEPPLSSGGGLWVALGEIRHNFDTGLRDAAAGLGRTVPTWVQRSMIVLWLAASTLLSLLLWAVHHRMRSRLRSCPAADLHGVRVRIAPDLGPAVIGVRRPEIIMPRWLLTLPEPEQRLVLAHEAEHLRARDPFVLLAGCVAIVLVPWHPGLYWMLARLRLAVELDCDARVLRGGASRRVYGSLLIALSGRGHGFRLAAPAFACGFSHLQRRLLMMKQPTSRFPRARGVALGAVAFLALLAACDVEMPTPAELDAMGVADAEESARRLSILPSEAADAVYLIDGDTVDAARAEAFPADQIARIEVVKKVAPGERPQIRIRTHSQAVESPVDHAVALATGEPDPMPVGDDEPDLLVLLDGEPVDAASLKTLDPAAIERIEVIKGPAAAEAFPELQAENGVIVITSRAAAPR